MTINAPYLLEKESPAAEPPRGETQPVLRGDIRMDAQAARSCPCAGNCQEATQGGSAGAGHDLGRTFSRCRGGHAGAGPCCAATLVQSGFEGRLRRGRVVRRRGMGFLSADPGARCVKQVRTLDAQLKGAATRHQIRPSVHRLRSNAECAGQLAGVAVEGSNDVAFPQFHATSVSMLTIKSKHACIFSL